MIQNLFNLVVLLMLLAGYNRNYKLWKGEAVQPRNVSKNTLTFGLVMILWAIAMIIF